MLYLNLQLFESKYVHKEIPPSFLESKLLP
jgi:hypothetical protein